VIVSRRHLLLEKVVDDNGMLQLNRDGSAIATNKKVFVALEGVSPKIQRGVPLPGKEMGVDSISMTDSTAKEVLKNVPRDKLFHGALEHVDVVSEGVGDFVAETTDGRRTRTIRGKAIERSMEPDPMLQRILGVLEGQRVVCLNRKRLLRLLEVLDKVAEDSTGESPVWMGFGENGDVALRCVDWASGQRALAYMSAYQDEGAEQPPASEWERSKWAGGPERPKPQPRRRRNAAQSA
jgi:hypothetical protein